MSSGYTRSCLECRRRRTWPKILSPRRPPGQMALSTPALAFLALEFLVVQGLTVLPARLAPPQPPLPLVPTLLAPIKVAALAQTKPISLPSPS